MSAERWHNLLLTEEEEMIVETARRLAEDELMAQAEETDREARFPAAIFQQMADLGFLALPISEDVGGAGMGSLAFCLALEEIAKASGSIIWRIGDCLPMM